ncbi:MAG TPA: ThiF family adenylyltransferase [Candidatus Acidoferrales bacterium]|nr:ThiF family adenylyltransferase [Candidatus Acidoferrales bacterium]
MKSRLTKKQLDYILLDLWQNSVFDDECFTLLEQYIKTRTNSSAETIDDALLDNIYRALATVRNRTLITSEGQDKLKNTVVGFFGMSVGSHAALTWMMESRADVIKIIDPDIITPTNLNRLRWGWDSIGKNKVDVVRQALLEVDPFVSVVTMKSKAQKDMKEILESHPRLDVIVDEIDDIEGKIALRSFAKENKIPLLSAADVGDNVILDIERYDSEPQTQPFLGRIPFIDLDKFFHLSDLERRNYIIKLVGFENNSEEMLDSLLAIGKSLSTWPQLGATATITGGVIATTIKKISLGEKVASGRYYLSLDDLLVKDFTSELRKEDRRQKIEKIKQKFNITE